MFRNRPCYGNVFPLVGGGYTRCLCPVLSAHGNVYLIFAHNQENSTKRPQDYDRNLKCYFTHVAEVVSAGF